MKDNKPQSGEKEKNSKKTLVNAIIWWGGLILYGFYYNEKHPDAGLLSSFTDIYSYIWVVFLWIIQAIVNKLYFKN